MPKHRIKIGFPEILVGVISVGVMLMFLGMIPFSPLPDKMRIAAAIGIFFQLGWLTKLVKWQLDHFAVHRFPQGREIVWLVSSGGAFFGACIGSPVGVELTGYEMGDMLAAAVLCGFYGAIIGLATCWILAVVCVGFFWLVAGSLLTRLPQSVAGFLTGLIVGGSLLNILLLSLPSGQELPSEKEEIMFRILMPAIVCGAYGSLAGRLGCRQPVD